MGPGQRAWQPRQCSGSRRDGGPVSLGESVMDTTHTSDSSRPSSDLALEGAPSIGGPVAAGWRAGWREGTLTALMN